MSTVLFDSPKVTRRQLYADRVALQHEISELPAGQGRALVADVLESLPRFILNVQIGDLLSWPRREDKESVRKRLRECGVVWGDIVSSEAVSAQRLSLARSLRDQVDQKTPRGW